MQDLIERCPRVAELDNNSLTRLKLMIDDVDESVGIDHLVNCLADGTSAGGDGVIRCYVGFEPSGKAHIGWKVISLQLKRMLDAESLKKTVATSLVISLCLVKAPVLSHFHGARYPAWPISCYFCTDMVVRNIG